MASELPPCDNPERDVYFIQCGPYCKIGTGQVTTRLRALSTANPEPLKLLRVIPGAGHRVERSLHSQFRKLRVRGEWFHYTAPLKEFVEGLPRTRHRNDGLRKLCSCPRRTWAKCEHPWHFNFKWAGEVYRFSLDRVVGRIVKDAAGKWRRDRATLGDRIDSKTAAESERDRLRAAIREGSQEGTAFMKPAVYVHPSASSATIRR